LKRALAIDEKALGPEHSGVATDLNNLAMLYDAEGRYADAKHFTSEHSRSTRKRMSEKERLQFLATLDSQFPAYFSFVHRYRDQDQKLVGEMYDLLLMEKGMVVGATAAVYRQIKASRDRRAVQTFQRLATTCQEMGATPNSGSEEFSSSGGLRKNGARTFRKIITEGKSRSCRLSGAFSVSVVTVCLFCSRP
jgi:hypothetical protein